MACGGRAFVLFTSYAQLRYAADTLRDLLERHGLSLWVHGEAPRLQLLTGFKETAGSVLFGTDSFWEGVDVQGEALSLVVIAKLPFEVPTHPVAQARTQRLRERGLNPFENYSVPRAALRLKQGFGRLIRSASDRGRWSSTIGASSPGATARCCFPPCLLHRCVSRRSAIFPRRCVA